MAKAKKKSKSRWAAGYAGPARHKPPAPGPGPGPAPAGHKTSPAKPVNDNVDLEAIVLAAMASHTPTVQFRVCRLCETKDGPFLNIFGAENGLAKKIDELLPVVVEEYDDLPHKICYRCSAKVEELHEFAQKCIKTQKNLRRNLGKVEASPVRHIKGSKLYNEYNCESAIQKAMEAAGLESVAVKNITPSPIPGRSKQRLPSPPRVPTPPQPSLVLQQKKPIINQPQQIEELEDDLPINDDNDLLLPVKQVKVVLDRVKKSKAEERTARVTRSVPIEPVREEEPVQQKNIANIDLPVNEIIPQPKTSRRFKKNAEHKIVFSTDEKKPIERETIKKIVEPEESQIDEANNVSDHSKKKEKELIGATVSPIIVEDDENDREKQEQAIMQNVSTIKVGGAGYLFQCKICKRNFLKKEVVLTHSCARNVLVKSDPPKLKELPKMIVPKPLPKPTPTDKEIIQAFKNRAAAEILPVETTPMPPLKHRPGPASRKRVIQETTTSSVTAPLENQTPPPVQSPFVPSVNVPMNFPGAKNRYKLVPGPNNTYTLVEDGSASVEPQNTLKRKAEEPKILTEERQDITIVKPKTYVRRKDINQPFKPQEAPRFPVPHNQPIMTPWFSQPVESHIIANLQSQPMTSFQSQPMTPFQNNSQPYPVGLFQTIPRITTPAQPIPTPAMKKQSYTVVPTGNPSKLVLSTKPVPEPAPPPPTPAKAKKGNKKTKRQESITPEVQKQPFNVTIEDSAPSGGENNDGFFTFINVDPLLQPSYVLPTNNIIQESQISTSTPPNGAAKAAASKALDKDVYKCELCAMAFSREKKLLAHLQSHYRKAEEEEELSRITGKKRSRKS